jgi:hypothetical protein
MRNYVIGGVDWKQYWVRTVVCGDTGEELNRAVWPRDEAEDHLVAFFQSQRDLYGVPMMVIGRCGSHWPDQILEGFWLAGFMVELYDGPTLGRLLRMEREYREDVSYRYASLLAAVHLARHRTPEVQELETFLLQWSIYQTKQRLNELQLELESSHPQWNEHGIEAGLRALLKPPVFSNLVCRSMLPS